MHRIAFAIAALLACSTWAVGADQTGKADRVFQMDRLLTIRIRMSAEQWRMMQPSHASRVAVALGVAQHPTTQQVLQAAGQEPQQQPPIEGERRPPSLIGNEYAYVGATVTVDDRIYEKVGVRFKGQWAYTLAGTSPRRPLKLSFDHFVDGQKFEGVESLSLNTNALDPSQLRESLGYALFRDAGVPTPRTCFALVYLTVDGLYNNELLGLYTAVEEVNKDFLKSCFGTAKGLVIRPERVRNLAYLGPDWNEYRGYNIQTDPTPFTTRRFMDFTRLINNAGDEEFCTEISSYVDADQFLRFLAANVLMINLDGLLVNGHNFYIYVHPTTGKLCFIPWDLHLAFGWQGQTPEQWMGLTIDRPYRVGNRLLERMMMVGWMRDAYREYLRELATGCFAPANMNPRIAQLEQVVRKAHHIAWFEGKELPVTMTPGAARPRPELRDFVAGRVQSVLDQLAGRVEGEPVGGRQPVRPPPPPVKPAPPPAPKRLTAFEQVAALLAGANKPRPTADVPAGNRPPAPPTTRSTAAATRPATTRPAPLPAPKVTPPPPPKPRPIVPNPWAPMILSNLDANGDGHLNRDEVADAARHVFIAHAQTRHGPIDETSLSEALDRIGRMLLPFPPSVDDNATRPEPSRQLLAWAKAILQRATPSTSGPKTLSDLLAAASTLFDEADTNHDNLLNSREIGLFMGQVALEMGI